MARDRIAAMRLRQRPVALIIRDGWGHNPHPEWNHANAIHLANTPVNDRLLNDFPWTQIRTSGEDVGLPAGVMGNSEVGHQNIGAGRIVDQEVMRITRAIRDASFFEKPSLVRAFKHARRNGASLHLMGLVSDGRVHSDLEHALAIVDLAKRLDFDPSRFFVHAFTDGRDTAPNSGLGFVRRLEKHLEQTAMGRIASVAGRFYAMDRDHRWNRVEQAWRTLVSGSEQVSPSALQAIEDYYRSPSDASRTGDEFITPVSIAPSGRVDPAQCVRSGDAVVFFNFRGDRPRELTKAFVLSDEEWQGVQGGGFPRGDKIDDLHFATMTSYEKGLPVQVIFDKPAAMRNILGAYVSALGLRQFRCAETEKYPHVTFFFNDYRDEPFAAEDRTIVPSPRDVATYDQKPEMSAHGVTDEVVGRLESGLYDLVVVNFANPDMVGHTGSIAAAVLAVETVDSCLGLVLEALGRQGGSAIVTADHGNCEQMIDPATGGPHTAHTTYDVDLIVVDEGSRGAELRPQGRLADIAPTVLDLMGLEKPPEMTGSSLLPSR